MFGGSHTYYGIACHQLAKRVMSRPVLTGRMYPPSWKVVSKNFAKNYGLVVQLGGVEELNALGKGGSAQRKPILVLL